MSSQWLKRYDNADALTLLAAWQWWLRAAVFVAAAAIVLTANGAIAIGIVELAIAAAALTGWWASDRLPEPWARRALLTCLTVLAAVGGFAATSHQQTSVLVVAIVALLAAGAELPLAGLVVVFLVGVLAVEVGAVRYGDTDLATMLGYPAVLAGLVLTGRYRRAYRIQSEQAEALLAETRRAQFEAERAAALTERTRRVGQHVADRP